MGDYGGSPSAAAAELHLKMSKKIAQLTKVIFHLNTRNEDFQTEFTHLKQVHAIEQQQLTADAAAKLRLLSEQLQTHKDADARAARDKQLLLKDLAVFQQQATAAQQAVQLEFQRRVQSLEEQVETSRRAFVDRIQQLTLMAETLQRRASAATSASDAAHRSAIDELQRKHSDEIEQVVMTSNARFTQMLGEQLKLQDALRAEFAKEKAQWEANARQQQQQWENEKDDTQRRFDETKQQLISKMEALLADAETLRGHETRLRADKDDLLKAQGELQRQLKILELHVTKAQQETQSVRKDTDANAQKLLQSLGASNATIEQLTRELDALKKSLASRDAALDHATKERDALQLELLQGSASLSEKHAQHTQQLSERDLKLANLQNELALQRQQAAASDALQSKKIQTLEARVAELVKEVDELQKKLANAEMLRASEIKEKDKTQSDLKAKLEQADKTVVALRIEHSSALEELKQTHTKAIDALTKSHADAVDGLRRDADKRVADVETKLTQHSSASMDNALREATQQHALAIAQLQAAADASAATWAKEKAERVARIQTLETDLKRQIAATADATAKIAELTTKLQQLDAQLVQVRTDKDTLQKATQKTQKDRDEAFQKQFKDLTFQRENALKRLTSEKDKLVADHQQALNQLRHEHTEKLSAAHAAWTADQHARLESQQSELSASYEQQLKDLNDQLSREREQFEAAVAAARENLERLNESRASDEEDFKSQLRRAADQFDQRLNDLEQSHALAIEALTRTHTGELNRLQTSHQHDLDDQQKALNHQAEQTRVRLLAQQDQLVVTLRQEHAAALTALEESLTAQRHSEALALRAEMAHKLKELRVQKDGDHTRVLTETTQAHIAQLDALKARLDALQRQLDATQRALDNRTADWTTAQREGESLVRALDAKTRESHERIASLERLNREDVERLKLASKRDMDRLLAETVAETKDLSDRFEATRQLLTDNIAALKRTVLEWEAKYARRESRGEDVARINELEKLVVEKDALVRQTLDEMAYFKRELLNREEMYNKTFARTPNVGVLNVLKPHVLRQAQLQQNQNQQASISNVGPVPVPPASQHSARRPKLQKPEELQRRGSERGTPGAVAARKALPPLGNNNQAFGL